MRAQKANFQEAQNAINEIFQTIKGDTDLSYNLIFSPTAADYSLSKLAISDKDVDALEILLRYNQRLLEQEKITRFNLAQRNGVSIRANGTNL